MKRLLPFLLPSLVLCLAPAACSLRRPARGAPLPIEATRSLARARELARTRPPGWWTAAREAAGEAARIAPGWIAPQRVLDDVARERLLGHQALAARRAALDQAPTAEALYLAGRLEGRAGIASLERAARLDPGLAWAQHGLAWNRFLDGDARLALRLGERALALARGSSELGAFASARARYLLDLERTEEAIELLAETLDDPRLEEPERTELEVWLSCAELASDGDGEVERGSARAILLLEGARLTGEEYERLGDELLARPARSSGPDAFAALLAALEGEGGPGRERLRARVLLERGARGLAGAVLGESAGGASGAGLRRALELERGRAGEALERWRTALPARLLDEGGLPREPALRELVLAARAAGERSGAVEFGAALLRAGWFAEAGSWSAALVEQDPAAALALATRAAAGQALLAGIRGVLAHVDEARAVQLPGQDPGALPLAREIASLDELLAALQPFFERYQGREGGGREGGGRELGLERALVDSPRLAYGGLAELVHPGPLFSPQDESAGRGRAGASVPGLSAELARIGRFGIFGQVSGGGGPDGTVLRLVGSEWKSGEHLGVPFAGRVAWCEGADVPSRPARNGSSVSGAALHEGYWIDIEGARRDQERVRALEREFLEGDPPGLEQALAGRGPRLPQGAGPAERGRFLAPLGEGERVLLGVLRERAAAGRARGERVGFEELLELTALHEEGHLTDRTRFLPLARRWPRVLAFAARHLFAPRAIARALEYRAQLVALCVAAEPRLALADCLAAADGEGGVLPHGDAYRELVEDLLRLLAREVERHPVLDREHYLVHQLHFLGGEEVRELALELARAEGLVQD